MQNWINVYYLVTWRPVQNQINVCHFGIIKRPGLPFWLLKETRVKPNQWLPFWLLKEKPNHFGILRRPVQNRINGYHLRILKRPVQKQNQWLPFWYSYLHHQQKPIVTRLVQKQINLKRIMHQCLPFWLLKHIGNHFWLWILLQMVSL